MSTSAVENHPRACSVRFTDSDLVVELVDGRTVSVPVLWFPRLSRATSEQLAHFEIMSDGEGIHWPDLDEDLSVAGLLKGDH